MTSVRFRSLGAIALLVVLPAQACPGLAVENAWIRESPPGAMMTAAYAQLVNGGARALIVDGAFSDAFAGAELHRSLVENGMQRMVRDVLPLAAGARAALEPGGWHLMLMRPSRPLKAGERVPLALKCGTQASEFIFTVKAAE